MTNLPEVAEEAIQCLPGKHEGWLAFAAIGAVVACGAFLKLNELKQGRQRR